MKNSHFLAFGRSLSALVVFLALIGLGGSSINAQTPLARFVLPTNTTATAVNPTFKIITSLPIDTTSVHWDYVHKDSLTLYTVNVCVIPYEVYTSESDTFWQGYARAGTGSFTNDTTILFTSNPLLNGHKYEAILMGLRVISGIDTIVISDTIARLTFTTVDLPPSLISMSVVQSGQIVRTHDTITALFTEKLDSTSSSSGPLFSLAIPKVTFDTTHDTIIVSDSMISATAWLDATDSSKLHLLPTHPFTLGQDYRVKVKLSGLTGDTTEDGKWGFVCKKSFLLNLTAMPTGGLTCLNPVHFDPTINENYRAINDSQVVFDTSYVGRVVNAGDTARYTAPTHVGGAVFTHWSGSGNLAIDTSTNPVLTITQTSDQLNDMNIVALYGPVAVDTLCVAVSGTRDSVRITSDSLDCPLATLLDTCATTSSINYLLERGKIVTLHAYTQYDSEIFNHWSSSNSAINNLTNPVISFVTTGNTCATAVFNRPTSGQYQLWDFVTVDGMPGPADPTIAQIIAPVPVPPTTAQAMSTSTGCALQPATVKILNPNYGLESYSVDEGTRACANITDAHDFTKDAPNFQPKDLYVATGMPYPCPGNGTFTPPDATQDDWPPTFVTFVVKPLVRKLILVLRTNNNTHTEGTLLTFTDPNTTKATDMWCWVKTKPLSWKQLGTWTFFPIFQWVNPAWCNDAQPTYVVYELDYLSGTTVELKAGVGSTSNTSADNFVQWELPCSPVASWCGCTNTEFPTPLSTADFSFVMSQDEAATATYHVPFKLLSVGFLDQPNYSSSTTQGITKSVANWGTRQVGLTGSGSPWPSSAYTGVRFDFNKPVGTTTWGLVPITFTEESSEFGKTNGDVATLRPKTGSGTPPSINGQISGNSLYFWLDGSFNGHEYRLWKGQKFNFNVSSAVASADHEALSNPQTLEMSSINPNVSWKFHNTYVDDAHDVFWNMDNWGFEEWAGVMSNSNGSTINRNWSFTCIRDNVESGTDYAPTPYNATEDYHCGCGSSGDLAMITDGGVDPETNFFSAGAVSYVVENGAGLLGDGSWLWCQAWDRSSFDHTAMSSHTFTPKSVGDQIRAVDVTQDASYDALRWNPCSSPDDWGSLNQVWWQGTNNCQPVGRLHWWGADSFYQQFWGQPPQSGSWSRIDFTVHIQ
jgi:hypothetical protein